MDYSIFWTGIQNYLLKQDVPDMFLNQLQYYSFLEKEKSLTLVTPNDFLKDFINSNYKQTIENALLQCWNQKITIEIVVNSDSFIAEPQKVAISPKEEKITLNRQEDNFPQNNVIIKEEIKLPLPEKEEKLGWLEC